MTELLKWYNQNEFFKETNQNQRIISYSGIMKIEVLLKLKEMLQTIHRY